MTFLFPQDPLEVGVAGGKLASQLFPTAQMKKVLRNKNKQLPVGWTVSSSDLWVIFREVTVFIAVVDDKFRVFNPNSNL